MRIITKSVDCRQKAVGKVWEIDKSKITILVLALMINCFDCVPQAHVGQKVIVGAEQLDLILPKLQGKRIGLVLNYTATIGKTHLADTLKALQLNIRKIFSPEHGFRGSAADGEVVNDVPVWKEL